ncbi:MAG: hypothetical protein WB460_20030 [Candidatus Acidiferrales bacterium]
MRDSIVEKLRTVLSENIDNEGKVVYLLAECRKLFPEVNPVPFALNMYCNWALHVDLDRSKTTKEFLEQVDGFIDSVLRGSRDIRAENTALNHFVQLDTLREQLRDFLLFFGLPSALCDDDACWHEFVEHYSGVIEDGSVSCASGDLRFVEKVIFSRGQRQRAGSYIPFDLVWEIVLKGGRKIVVEGSASPLPSGKPMRVWTVRL